ncbi:MAG: hypothetical protein ABJN82_00065, partial [Marinobacter alexandrii]
MRAGLIASLVGHTTILVWGIVALPDAESFTVPQVESLPVDLIPVEEFTQLRLGEKTAEIRDVAALQPSETPNEEPPQPADKPGESQVEQPTPPTAQPEPAPAPEPAPQPTSEPEPAPTPEPVPTAEPLPEPQQQQEAAPTPQPIVTSVAPRTKPKPPKAESVINQAAALLNKVEPRAQSGSSSQQQASLGSNQGAQNIRMTQSELDALRGQVSQCWSPPVGAVGAEELKVRVRFNLSQNGEVSGSPEV